MTLVEMLDRLAKRLDARVAASLPRQGLVQDDAGYWRTGDGYDLEAADARELIEVAAQEIRRLQKV